MRKTPVVALALALALPLWPAAPSEASSALQVSTVSHGLKLALSVPQGSYPRDALVQVLIQARNVSNREIDLQGTPGRCTACSLHLGEVDARGGPAPVPSRLQGFSAPLSGPTTQVLLLPGRSLTHRVTIVLWSDYLQAGTTIWSRSGGRLSSLIVSTPTLTLHLYPAPAPRVQLRVTDREPEALIHPSAGVHGPYLYQASVLCRTENGTSVAAEQPALGEVDDLWAAGSGPTLTPLPCPTAYGPTSLSRWHAVLGWLNHAVGTVSYVKH